MKILDEDGEIEWETGGERWGSHRVSDKRQATDQSSSQNVLVVWCTVPELPVRTGMYEDHRYGLDDIVFVGFGLGACTQLRGSQGM